MTDQRVCVYNELMKNTFNNLRHIPDGVRMGVAVSGGVDSMCLLHALLFCESIDRERVTVINVDHMIRGEQSARDSEFVRAVCEKAGVKFEHYKINVPQRQCESKRSVESEARAARYEAFEDAQKRLGLDIILTAHNKNDNTESILMHVLRGCGVSGLRGMSFMSDALRIEGTDGVKDFSDRIVRPMIETTRAQIEAYAAQNGVEYVSDETNSDSSYTRNFLRNEVLPALRERFEVDGAIEKLSFAARHDDEFINAYVPYDEAIKTDKNGEVKVNVETLASAPLAVSTRILRRSFTLVGKTADVERGHLIIALGLTGADNGKRFSFGGVTVVKEYSVLGVYRDEQTERHERFKDECEPFECGVFPFADGVISVSSVDPVVKRGELIFDLDSVPEGAVVRFRRAGDVFKPYGGGEKKLKDYFIDRKIPVLNRDNFPLLCYNSKVLAVIGMEISDDIKLTDKTVNAATITFERDE